MKNNKSPRVFEIRLDLSNCHTLYDYVRQERFKQPDDGIWNLSDIIRKTRRSPQEVTRNKRTTKCHKKLEAIHSCKDFFDKVTGYEKKIEKLIKLERCHDLVLPPWVLPVYHPGDVITGAVYVDAADDKIAAENIKVHFKGAARTRIRVYSDAGYHDYLGYTESANTTTMLWQKNGKENSEFLMKKTDVDCEEEIFTDDQKRPKSFPFEFHIHDKAQASVPELIEAGDDFAHISYFIKATYTKGNRLGIGNVVVNQPIWVVTPEKLFYLPQNVNKIKQVGFFNANSVIHCSVTIPPAEQVPEDGHLPVVIEIENSSQTKVTQVKCRLLLNATYRNRMVDWNMSRKVTLKGHKVTTGQVESGMCPVFHLDLPFSFKMSDGFLLPQLPYGDRSLIQLVYSVYVVVKLKGVHRSMHLLVPAWVTNKVTHDKIQGKKPETGNEVSVEEVYLRV